ncbi:MAG: nicotinate-nucleotide adenylyltransferase [Proteobacteria bacterium]|nr:nicotinate-nucleotide adenylyltransferase [Burkholderiales bacterium]
MRPIGILGGTFNPVHYGHLRIAEELCDALDLDEVRLMPANLPPLRTAPGVSGAERLHMVRLGIAGNARLSVDEREVAKTSLCYTVDTLGELRAEFGPQRPICLMLGADAFARLHRWHRWRDLFELAHFAVAERGGHPSIATAPLDHGLAAELRARRVSEVALLAEQPAGAIYLAPTSVLQISATRIRALIGRGSSARYLLPPPVLDYIHERGIYRRLDES